MRVAVVGAGIVGLATGFELMEAGAEVRLYERTGVASQQSRGSTRIYRAAHADPHLARLAIRARECWRAWERRFGRRLIGDEGLLVTGAAIVDRWHTASREAGAPVRPVTPADAEAMLPIARLPTGPVLLDPTGGATRIRRAVELLRERLATRTHLAEVHAIEPLSDGCLVRTGGGEWRCDEVVLTAGIDTARLAAPLGLAIEQTLSLQSRFTFAMREAFRGRSPACWIDAGPFGDRQIDAYAQPVGTTGRYALGLSWDGQARGPEVGADEVSRQSLAVVRAYVRTYLPGLEPEPVDEIRCVSGQFPFLDRDDGFIARRAGRVTAFYGNNLFKFGPLLGALLRDAALHGEVPEELRALDPARV